ncbi:MAG: hypothetical protein D6718_05590, partial [Acidobacteria bacterium]
LEPVRLARAPALLTARLRALAAASRLRAGDAGDALEIARDALLDLEEADRAEELLPRPLAPIAGEPSALGLELADLAARAGVSAGVPVAAVTSEFLRNLARIARRWSARAAPWPEDTGRWSAGLPAGSCLVVAAAPGDGFAVALSPELGAWTGPAGGVAQSPPCRSARAVIWLGPAPPPGGLALEGSTRVLLRWPGPLESTQPAGASASGRATRVGPGRPRPIRRVVEELAGSPEVSSGGEEGALYVGAGLALTRFPLASGWLVPPAGDDPDGWCGPFALQRRAGGPEGLMALGVRFSGVPGTPETGPWVLAEAALAAGHRFLLLSRRPLEEAEIARIARRWSRWQADPLAEAGRTAREAPELARVLELWGTPDLAVSGSKRKLWPWVLAALIAGAVAWLLAARRF